MNTSKALYSQWFSEYNLKADQLEDLHSSLLNIFLDVKKVCDDNHISYMMTGGSLLGTVRHQGFIPWDDDIDLMMLRSEYEKFRKIFDRTLGDQYILAEPLCHPRYFSKMPKIFKKETKYVEIPTAGADGFDMLFVDLFIIENVPKSRIIRKIRGMIYDIAYKGSSACIDYLYPSPVIEKKAKENPDIKKYFNFRKRIGWIFSHFGGVYFYIKLCEKLGKYRKDTGYMGIPAGISYNREIFPKEVFTKLSMGIFCGYEVPIPGGTDAYLENLYGDYMKLPPIEERQVHGACLIEL